MKESLKDRIHKYFKGRPQQWIASTEIERLVAAHTEYSASNGARRLRDLFEEGELEREHRPVNGKTLAYYKLKSFNIAEVQKSAFAMWDGIK